MLPEGWLDPSPARSAGGSGRPRHYRTAPRQAPVIGEHRVRRQAGSARKPDLGAAVMAVTVIVTLTVVMIIAAS